MFFLFRFARGSSIYFQTDYQRSFQLRNKSFNKVFFLRYLKDYKELISSVGNFPQVFFRTHTAET